MNKQQGISLLEVLLTLTIMALITMMSVRYFNQAIVSREVEQAVLQIQQLTQVSYEWLEAQKQADFSSQNGGQMISLQTLETAGFLNNRLMQDPWGGAVQIEAGADPSYVHIVLTQVPQKACRNLNRQLQTMNHAPTSQCDGLINNYSGDF